ncbi:MAG: hypothetical protein U1D30_24410 [Planctomycetota bacterium]
MDASSNFMVEASTRTRPIDRIRYLYAATSALLLVLTFLGFQQFYLRGKAFPDRPLTPPIRTLVIAHGVSMSAWMILLLVQSLLVVGRKNRLHMALGKVGGVLAVAIFVLGFKLGIEATRVSPPEVRLWNLPYKQFMAVPIISITIFAWLVGVGIWKRRRPEIHRPAMLLATLAAMSAAMDRIDAIASLYRQSLWGALFGPFFSALVIGAVFLLLEWGLTRKFDRYFAVGFAGLVAASAGIMRFATTDAWDHIADFLLG